MLALAFLFFENPRRSLEIDRSPIGILQRLWDRSPELGDHVLVASGLPKRLPGQSRT